MKCSHLMLSILFMRMPFCVCARVVEMKTRIDLNRRNWKKVHHERPSKQWRFIIIYTITKFSILSKAKSSWNLREQQENGFGYNLFMGQMIFNLKSSVWSHSRLKWIENLCKSICVLPTHPKPGDCDINSRIWVALAADTNLILLLLCRSIVMWIFFHWEWKCNAIKSQWIRHLCTTNCNGSGGGGGGDNEHRICVCVWTIGMESTELDRKLNTLNSNDYCVLSCVFFFCIFSNSSIQCELFFLPLLLLFTQRYFRWNFVANCIVNIPFFARNGFV